MNALALWWFLIYMLLVGMAAGWLAWVVLGKSKALTKDRKPNWGLILGLGIVGSFVGGMAASLLTGQGLALHPSGMIGSFLGAVAVLAIYVGVKK
jgi:uncharacterized membrane protein YeaQ/YmgE (transglycosylase-associated protein family)